jgi:hypothetical protein
MISYKHLIAYIGQKRDREDKSSIGNRFFLNCYLKDMNGNNAWNYDALKKLIPNLKRVAGVYLEFTGYVADMNNGDLQVVGDGPRTDAALGVYKGVAIYDKPNNMLIFFDDIDNVHEIDLKSLANKIDSYFVDNPKTAAENYKYKIAYLGQRQKAPRKTWIFEPYNDNGELEDFVGKAGKDPRMVKYIVGFWLNASDFQNSAMTMQMIRDFSIEPHTHCDGIEFYNSQHDCLVSFIGSSDRFDSRVRDCLDKLSHILGNPGMIGKFEGYTSAKKFLEGDLAKTAYLGQSKRQKAPMAGYMLLKRNGVPRWEDAIERVPECEIIDKEAVNQNHDGRSVDFKNLLTGAIISLGGKTHLTISSTASEHNTFSTSGIYTGSFYYYVGKLNMLIVFDEDIAQDDAEAYMNLISQLDDRLVPGAWIEL